MRKEDYKEALRRCEKDYETARQRIHTQWALSIAEFKKGDIISSGSDTIQVDKIGISVMFGEAKPYYQGYLLKKDLTKRVDNQRTAIFNTDNIKLIETI